MKGNNGQENERSGAIEFLSDDKTEVLFTLSLKHIGIFKADSSNDDSNAIRKVNCEFYVEEMAMNSGDSWAKATPKGAAARGIASEKKQ